MYVYTQTNKRTSIGKTTEAHTMKFFSWTKLKILRKIIIICGAVSHILHWYEIWFWFVCPLEDKLSVVRKTTAVYNGFTIKYTQGHSYGPRNIWTKLHSLSKNLLQIQTLSTQARIVNTLQHIKALCWLPEFNVQSTNSQVPRLSCFYTHITSDVYTWYLNEVGYFWSLQGIPWNGTGLEPAGLSKSTW